jgi:hypothetical protein
VIVAHHMGEDALPSLIAGGATAVPLLFIAARARLARLRNAVRRRLG